MPDLAISPPTKMDASINTDESLPSPAYPHRHVVVGIDGGPRGRAAMRWACRVLLRGGDADLHLVTVLPPPHLIVVYPPGFTAPGSTVRSAATRRAEERDDEARAAAHLELCASEAQAYFPTVRVSSHLVPHAGGASGAGRGLLEFAEGLVATLPMPAARRRVALVVGTRGLSAAGRAGAALVGLGSVAEWLVGQERGVPVVVHRSGAEEVRPTPQEIAGQTGLRVLVCVDGSTASEAVLDFALPSVLVAGDKAELHVVCAAPPAPPPDAAGAKGRWGAAGGYLGGLDDAAADTFEEGDGDSAARALARATDVCMAAIDEAADRCMPRSSIFWRALAPEGGASGVAESIRHYARVNRMDLVVVGSRGHGALRRTLDSALGVGSVSRWLLHHLDTCTVAVTPFPRGKGSGRFSQHGERVKGPDAAEADRTAAVSPAGPPAGPVLGPGGRATAPPVPPPSDASGGNDQLRLAGTALEAFTVPVDSNEADRQVAR